MTESGSYLYPGSDVLRNKAGIRTVQGLEEHERRVSGLRLMQLEAAPVKGAFNAQHYRATHEAIFGDIYDFAGKPRTVDIRKWSEERRNWTLFVEKERVEPLLTVALQGVEKGGLRYTSHDEFVERASRLYLDLNAIHPFREGNGRTQREFVRTVGLHAGYDIDWSRPSPKELLHATVEAAHDRTKRGDFAAQLSKAVTNIVPSRAMMRSFDEYNMSSRVQAMEWTREESQAPRALSAALRESAQQAPGKIAFVAADWKESVVVRVASPERAIEAAVGADGARVFGVANGGSIYDMRTGRDVYLRLDEGGHIASPRLRAAADQHFAGKKPSGPSTQGPDVVGP